MANEYRFHSTGNVYNKFKRFRAGGTQVSNGTTWVSVADTSDSDFGSLGVYDLDEVQTDDGTSTGLYTNPNNLTPEIVADEFGLAYDADTPVPGQHVTGAATPHGALAKALGALVIESGISAGAGLVNDTGTQLTTLTLAQCIALIASATAAVLAGAATSTVTIKPVGKPAGSDRIIATVSSGNRSTVNLRVPD